MRVIVCLSGAGPAPSWSCQAIDLAFRPFSAVKKACRRLRLPQGRGLETSRPETCRRLVEVWWPRGGCLPAPPRFFVCIFLGAPFRFPASRRHASSPLLWASARSLGRSFWSPSRLDTKRRRGEAPLRVPSSLVRNLPASSRKGRSPLHRPPEIVVFVCHSL
jgi:hypothetical protein